MAHKLSSARDITGIGPVMLAGAVSGTEETGEADLISRSCQLNDELAHAGGLLPIQQLNQGHFGLDDASLGHRQPGALKRWEPEGK